MIRSTLSISVAVPAFVAILSVSASADPTPAATATVSPADPCGDSNLLATTDRPTFGTNPCVVKPQTVIAEFGYRNTTTSGTGGGSNLTSYPGNRDRIGLLPHLELVLDTPTSLRLAAAGSLTTGDSNIGTGLKYEFGYFGNFVHGVAAEVVYPTSSAPFSNGLPSFNESYQIGGGIVRNVGFNLTLGFNSFSTPNPAGGKNVSTTAFQPTFILGGMIAPGTKLNVEVANNSSSGPNTSGQYFGNVFLQHQFAKFLLIDAEAAQRFTVVNGNHVHYFGAGGSWRL
jgi:hypothetical protein